MARSIVDSHVHVWSDGTTFAQPDHADLAGLRGDASVQTLLGAMRAAQVDAAVLVQYIGYRWDNEYVAEAIKNRPDIFVGVCRIDPEDPLAPDHLTHWTKDRGFHGVRFSLQAHKTGDWLAGPLCDPLFLRASDLNVPVLVLTKPSRLADLATVLDRHPDLDIIIDHIADCEAENAEHVTLLKRLSLNPRVYIKTGHLWNLSSSGYPWQDQFALIKLVRDLFGASRVMWGSDWSFCLKSASYMQTLDFLQHEAAFLTSVERDWIMGETARRLWKFPDRSGARATLHRPEEGHEPMTLDSASSRPMAQGT